MSGADTIAGGSGVDDLDGGDGDDVLTGGPGIGALRRSDGDDVIRGGDEVGVAGPDLPGQPVGQEALKVVGSADVALLDRGF
ncbi:MAG: Alkaline phosphatase [uncultured Chloroflexi bacterium]|uniref:Alkaline phosphatase n=1 Tax=uncultured Chloroflexota bacterium TaxID=166587 RepID=A0A6J4HF76_9CHLR|nr:MAG: Alkaline phosphatase [uncultured Chloroflexota bacterium]